MSEVLRLESVATGLTSPVGAAHAGDGSGRLFVVDQPGQVRILDTSTGLLATPYMDVGASLVSLGVAGPGTFDERGLLSMAFHPDYVTNGKFYTYTSQPVSKSADFTVPQSVGESYNHQSVITEWTAMIPSANIFDGTSRELMRIDQPQFNHNGGQLAFGPDGNLFISLGDGGAGSDIGSGHTAGIGNGQDFGNVLGSIVRIDVDGSNSSNGQYGIPATNPFVSDSTVPDELFAYGLRNPWRFSFDDGHGGSNRLFLGDVGQNRFEEINIVESGKNYGWNRREAGHFFDPANPSPGPGSGLSTGPNGEVLIDPIVEYFNTNNITITPGDSYGRAVIAGFVYRGSNSRMAAFTGDFVFGDWSRGFGEGNGDGSLFVAQETSPGVFAMSELLVNFDSGPERLNRFLFSFGEDEEGELYLLTNETGIPFDSDILGATGEIFRIVPEPASVAMVIVIVMPSFFRRNR